MNLGCLKDGRAAPLDLARCAFEGALELSTCSIPQAPARGCTCGSAPVQTPPVNIVTYVDIWTCNQLSTQGIS